MNIQSIGMQTATSGVTYDTRQSQHHAQNFGQGTYAIVPANTVNEDSFTKWAGKNVLTASIFSVIWDMGTNFCANAFKSWNIEKVSGKTMLANIPKVAGVFLLIGGIFKVVNNIIDKNSAANA